MQSDNPTPNMRLAKLDAETIRALFGSFDAEEEAPDRFREYFVTNSFYEAFTSHFPLRIAVGNKGSGKSALLKASMLEDEGLQDHISVPLTASELVGRADNLPQDSLRAINHWKSVFATEAAAKLITSGVLVPFTGDTSRVMNSFSSLLTWLSKEAAQRSKGLSDVVIKAGLNLNSAKSITFYLDDLDKGWDGRIEGLHFVNSILNACYDISKRDENIKFKIALRWDLWDAISRVNSDIDKIRQNAVFLRWSNHEIYIVVARRVAKFFNIEFPYKMYLDPGRSQGEIASFFDPILERTFRGVGKWDQTPTRQVILSMTRNRPRDLIALLTLAAEEANRKSRVQINTNDLNNIFPRYSEERLNDLMVEYGTRLSGMEELLLSFKPARSSRKTADSFRFTNDRMTKHLKELLQRHGTKIRFAYEGRAPDYRRLIDFLYRIDFISAWFTHKDDRRERVSFQDRQLAVSGVAEFGYSWEVLPAYRWAIEPTDVMDVLNSLTVD